MSARYKLENIIADINRVTREGMRAVSVSPLYLFSYFLPSSISQLR